MPPLKLSWFPEPERGIGRWARLTSAVASEAHSMGPKSLTWASAMEAVTCACGARQLKEAEQVQATNKAQVADLGLNCGAGDENRTRTLSLGS